MLVLWRPGQVWQATVDVQKEHGVTAKVADTTLVGEGNLLRTGLISLVFIKVTLKARFINLK